MITWFYSSRPKPNQEHALYRTGQQVIDGMRFSCVSAGGTIFIMRSSPASSLPAARRTTCSPTWREQALKGLCSQRPQQLRVRSLRETASHINVHHVERILRGLEPTQPAGRAARRRRTSRCPFRKDTQLFKRTQGFSRNPLINMGYAHP